MSSFSAAARRMGMTSAKSLGEMALGSLLGTEGRQWGEWKKLIEWIRGHGKFDVISLSNSLLTGLAPAIEKELGIPIICSLQGEDSFKFKRISDLDSLCDAGLLRYRWNRFGNAKLYYVTEAGATAVANDFKVPPEPFGENLSLALLVATLSGGQVTLEGIKDSKTVREIADDPVLRHTAVSQHIFRNRRAYCQLSRWARHL